MKERKEIKFKPTFFSKEHLLIFDPEFIELYTSPNDNDPVRFSKFEIDAFRFGVTWIRGYKTIFGRVNCIDIKSSTDEIIKIRLTSLYKIRLKQLQKKYSDILNSILQYYMSDIVGNYLRLFNHKQPFSILNVHFNQNGIQLNDKNNIEWNDVDLKSHTRYVGVSSKLNRNIYKGFDHWEEWNSLVLYNVIRLVLKNKNLLNN
jgi:hypothetical protein